jgi:transcriptional regulator with XRE-family HTH domain
MKNLRKYRDQTEPHLTHKQLVEELKSVGINLDQSMISHYERGVCTPSTKKGIAICNVLKKYGVDVTIEMLEA